MEDTQDIPAIALLSGDESEKDASLLDSLAAKRVVLAETRETYIKVQGYDEDPPFLVAKYRLVEGKELALVGQRVVRQVNDRYERQIVGALETMVAAIVGFYVDNGDGNNVPLTYNGQHLTQFNEELAMALKFRQTLPDNCQPRDVAAGLFGNNDIMIVNHAMSLNRWMGNTSLSVDEELVAGGNR